MANSKAFERLHPKLQRWLWKQGWASLREIQERAIPPIIDGQRDVLIAASTAGGKTEAAFLPICSTLVDDSGGSIRALYIGPLKALINDQTRRLEEMTEGLDIKVTPWHGDVAGSKKTALAKDPKGILLITPESLEALFVRRGTQVAYLFANLGHVVIDELHAFIGSERGWQLQSLLHRLEFVLKRRVPRIGLSATLGDLSIAADCLRPTRGSEVLTIESKSDTRALLMQLRGYVSRPPRLNAKAILDMEAKGDIVELEDTVTGDQVDISHHLFRVLRGKHNLAFANSRTNTEVYADLLRGLCERLRVPNEFFPHHGNLAKSLREGVEVRLKAGLKPTTAVCTTTLEMGIDIGSVESVAQVGVSATVSGLLQRLGRSGRRDNPAIFRLYLQEDELSGQDTIPDRLRVQLVQGIAMSQLLIRKWCEPPDARGLHLSTLLQQLLSVIAQYGGILPKNAYLLLCEEGPFKGVSPSLFGSLLRAMGAAKLITQSSDGTLLHGALGERLVNHYDFFAVFVAGEEFRLVHRGRTLGSLPISQPLFEGAFLIFGGRRWRVLNVRSKEKVIELERAAGGRAPFFEGSGRGQVHDCIRGEMFDVYQGLELPPFLDKRAQQLLIEGRNAFEEMELGRRRMVSEGPHVLLFPWRGDRILQTLGLQLRHRGLKVEEVGIALRIQDTKAAEVRKALDDIRSGVPDEPTALAAIVANKRRDKYDEHLGEGLLCLGYASRWLDVDGARGSAGEILEGIAPRICGQRTSKVGVDV